MLFAKRLSTLDISDVTTSSTMARTPKKLKHGHIDDDALAFAIYSTDGKMVLHDGDNGQDIPYSYRSTRPSRRIVSNCLATNPSITPSIGITKKSSFSEVIVSGMTRRIRA